MNKAEFEADFAAVLLEPGYYLKYTFMAKILHYEKR